MMKNTNEIEKALQAKIEDECKSIVTYFIKDLEKLQTKYGGSMYYDFQKDSADDSIQFTVRDTYGVSYVLHRMILKNHSENMLKYKSRELIKKLDLI